MSRKTAILALCFTPALLAAGDPAARLRRAATAPRFAAGTASAAFGRAETISATIKIVDVDKKLLFIKASDAVSYSFIVRPSTRISAGNQQIKLADLALQGDKIASVKFVPTRHGNIAQSIEVAK